MKKLLYTTLTAFSASAILFGCSGISQDDYEQLQSRYESVLSELESYEMQFSQLESELQTESIPETESAMEYSAIPSSDELMQMIASQNSNVGRYIVFDEETDLNGLLGRPGEYIGKASFEDIRLEQTMIDAGYENDYTGGTFEIFSTAEDCQKRYDYLLSLRNSGSGPYGLQDYMYKYDTVLFRLSFDLTPDQADEYHNIFDTIMSNYQDVSTQVSD